MAFIVKALTGLLLAVLLVVAGGIVYLENSFPKAGLAPQFKTEATPAHLERGKYLVNHVTACLVCHSRRDYSVFGAPSLLGTEGAGGQEFNHNEGVPGRLIAKNITPAALADWADGDILHAITSGVNKKGKALFPLMPYQSYALLADEDLASIIVYLRTLKPLRSELEETKLTFPMSLIVRTIPAPAPVRQYLHPLPAEGVGYGAYVTRAASCVHCHSQMDHGKILPGMEFAGGFEFRKPEAGYVVRSANITPDPETGIGKWSREQFIQRFKEHDPETSEPRALKPGEYNTEMPWRTFAGMTELDLGSIYDYLRTVKPVKNVVVRFEALTQK